MILLKGFTEMRVREIVGVKVLSCERWHGSGSFIQM